MKRRHLYLWGGLATTALAAWFAPQPEAVVAPARTAGRPSGNEVVPSKRRDRVLPIQPREASEDMPAVFAFEAPVEAPKAPAVSAPPPPPPVKAAPVEPQPPTPPFAAFGRYVDQGTVAVFLQYAGRNIVARPGDRINDQYVLESINERDVTVLYVPLNLRQTLDIGSGR